VRLRLTDVSPGLPDIPGFVLPRQPETVMSAPDPEPLRGYPTAVRRSFSFGLTDRPGG
jgi:hypothetical protein